MSIHTRRDRVKIGSKSPKPRKEGTSYCYYCCSYISITRTTDLLRSV